MRLIDADALGLDINRKAHENFPANRNLTLYAESLLAHAPTIDAVPVVHGKWAHLGGDEWCCTNCGEVIHTEGSWEKPDKKFCYECGARMDGE